MRRGAPKKSPIERRKRPRKAAGAATRPSAPRKAISSSKEAVSKAKETCLNCSKPLTSKDRALFVEEEVNRVFCSEPCITAYFAPEIQRLEKEFLRRLSPNDLSGEEREGLAHLRFTTLQEPDEVWREKTLTGDHRYTLVSEYHPSERSVWSICICLFLRGEPSFLFIAFTTRNEAMVNAYRRGERVQYEPQTQRKAEIQEEAPPVSSQADLGDRLADAWTEDETFLAQVNQERSETDIPPEEFELFQSCIEETLEAPDEVWSLEMHEPEGVHLYHFIRHYPNESPGYWYVILARETDNEEQIQILDAFPTRDARLVERYRRGSQEVGEAKDARPASRLVH